MFPIKGSGQVISGGHSFVPARIPTTFKTGYEVLGQKIKRDTWTLLISNLIWLFGTCGCMTLFVLFYVWADQSDRSLTVIHGAQDFRMQHQTWQLLGGKVCPCSRWESSCNFDVPILGHQPKMRRELLQAKAAGPQLCWIKKDWRRDPLGQNDPALYLHKLLEGIEQCFVCDWSPCAVLFRVFSFDVVFVLDPDKLV